MGGIRKFLVLFILSVFSTGLFLSVAKGNSEQLDRVKATAKARKDGRFDYKITIQSVRPQKLDWNLGTSFASDLKIEADGQRTQDVLKKKENDLIRLTSSKVLANRWDIIFSNYQSIKYIGDRELFKWYFVTGDHPYIPSVDIDFYSEVPIKKVDNESVRVLAFHGVGNAYYRLTEDNHLNFRATDLAGNSGLTVTASWQKGSFSLPFYRKIFLNLSGEELVFWSIFGLLLPLICFVFLMVIWMRKISAVKFDNKDGKREKSPFYLPPLMVGVLYDKKIYSHSLVATILDLCQKGYLIIIKKQGKYIFGKRKNPDEQLLDWEVELYDEIFSNNRLWSKQDELQENLSKELFSPRMRKIYEGVYIEVTKLGYFDKNPHEQRIKYKLAAICLYLISMAGACWVAITLRSSFLLIPLVGILISSFVIIKFAYLIPIQSKKGMEIRDEWNNFKNFLIDREPLPAMASASGLFYQYLPYALVFEVESMWAKRFRNYRIVLPDWYIESDLSNTEFTVEDIVKTIGGLSSQLTQLRGPSVR